MEGIVGLTRKEIEKKIQQGKTNKIKIKTNESFLKIIARNIFTYFNLIFTILAVLLITAGAYRNLSFLVVIIINILIGIFQQVRSKIVLDRLSLLDKNEYTVIRDGKEEKVNSDELVEGDCVVLELGSQIPADAVVISGKIYVNESLLTGEQDEIEKNVDSNLMSGSFVISGKAIVKLTKVGDESYSAKIMKDSKKIKETKSEMILAIDNIVKLAGIAIIPIGLLLFWGSYSVNSHSYTDSVNSMVSAVVGMIPEGLYLLTTVSLAISAMKLAKKQVLLHDMKSIESLARVDVLCVDKTGTITNNKMKVLDIFDEEENSVINNTNSANMKILAQYINTIEDNNITMDAIKNQLSGISSEKLINLKKEDFNSKNKYSFIMVSQNITYKLGAPDILIGKGYEHLVKKRAERGERVLAFVKEENGKTNPLLFISLKNEIRENAKEIFKFFEGRDVEIRVISGDNPTTVSAIAKQVGIKGYEKYIDCRELKSYEDIQGAVKQYKIFGRVSPEQKRQIIKALKELGLKVAMTGDGVNDILAMKEADCSIAVGAGADAAREASQVVLLDSDFGNMRNIVHEGRKNINNITRSASLFTYKNVFSLLLSVYSIICTMQYPLEPNQVSLGSAFTIGAPAFLLTFEENQKKQQNGNFIKKVLRNSLPSAITSFLAIVVMVDFFNLFNVHGQEITTACSYLFFTGGFLILYKSIRPLNKYRTSVLFLCILGIILIVNVIPNFFAIQDISPRAAGLVTLFGIAEFSVVRWVTLALEKLEKKRKKIFQGRTLKEK
ncbi:MAG: HAD-IC family P-type ATPase [Bacilli bacterium]|nr:HAD-IC family P-type ATPase [Bacilli bacterium]